MIKGQKSIRDGVEDFLCPFTDMYITQGSNSAYSHKGIMANDVRGKIAGVRYPYYAPCLCRAEKIYPSSGQVMWRSVNRVRFANGRIDFATFMTVHDNSLDVKVGQIAQQGSQLGNMGTKGNATGVHCHIQVSQSSDMSWYKNKYGVYQFNHEYDLDDCYFVDNTNIINGLGGNWRKTKTTYPATSKKRNYINFSPSIESRNVYDINTRKVVGQLKPKNYGGLSYYIYEYKDNNTYAVINTVKFGKVLVKITSSTPITVGEYLYQRKHD